MYRVFGYDDLCRDFDFRTDRFVEAIQFIRRKMPLAVIFTQGICKDIQRQLHVS